jgi:prevent-host-death family protein
VNVGQAKTDLSRLLARVEAGEDVEIARDGVPVARLVGIDPPHGPWPTLHGGAGIARGPDLVIQGATELYFSVVSFAEIGVKAASGKLVVPGDLHAHVVRSGLQILGLAADHGLAVAGLPMHHRDPFDRLLIAQARAEGLTLLTADDRIAAYDVERIDACS